MKVVSDAEQHTPFSWLSYIWASTCMYVCVCVCLHCVFGTTNINQCINVSVCMWCELLS